MSVQVQVQTLRIQTFNITTFLSRYMDILLGLCLLTSLVSLEYGSMTGERPPLALFLILSLATMAVFWLWFLYLKYAKMESEAAKEVRGWVPLG